MNTQQIEKHCTTKLGMTHEQAKWVVDNIYNYSVPDWSEMSWAEINQCLRDALAFKPVETTADKLRVGDTVQCPSNRVGCNHKASWRIIVRMEQFPNCIQVWDNLNDLHQFKPSETVQTQLLQLL